VFTNWPPQKLKSLIDLEKKKKCHSKVNKSLKINDPVFEVVQSVFTKKNLDKTRTKTEFKNVRCLPVDGGLSSERHFPDLKSSPVDKMH
jgi:hypothetical protein